MSSASSSPSGRPTSPGPSKLNKLLRVDRRDRSKSSPDAVPAHAGAVGGHPSSALPSSPSSVVGENNNSGKSKPIARKTSRLFNRKQRSPDSPASQRPSASDTLSSPPDPELADPPVIIEPPANARPRPRTKTPAAVDILSSSNSSTKGFSEFPSRLSGWLSHTFSGSSTDLSLPNLLSQSTLSASQVLAGSPKAKQPNALLTAARHSKGHLDKAMRFILDSDAQPNKSGEPIWLMGVQHPGFEPPPSPTTPISQPTSTPTSKRERRRDSDYTSSPSSFRPPSQNLTIHSNASNQSINSNAGSSVVSVASTKTANSWPPSFYADFTSSIWCTYRNSFSPIRDTSLQQLDPITPVAGGGPSIPSISEVVTSPSIGKTKWWSLPEKGWTSDSGWGCMLRTGQSLLANALVHLHLGRDWRKPVHPTFTPEYAAYVRILTWFLDSSSPLCPFSVHRMALAGKELGKEVGSWFGPSTAAGAIRRLAHDFPEAGIAVSVAADSVIYQSEVYLASNLGSVQLQNGAPKANPNSSKKSKWGDKTVLVLIGIRLGIDNVNPIYYETVKMLFTFPQSVGIAGGRPSSSYYFVGSQAESLFYLDPHHARPAIPLRPPPPGTPSNAGTDDLTDDGHSSASHSRFRPSETTPENSDRDSRTGPGGGHRRMTTSPSSTRSGSSVSRSQTYSHSHAPSSSSPLRASIVNQPVPSFPNAFTSPMDPVQQHYAQAYAPQELKTFHCERVRKMPLSGLDPSMLLGFLCKDESDWKDFRARVADMAKTHKPIFSIQDEPPVWPDDSDDLDMESVSEPELEADLDVNSSVVEDSSDTFLDLPDAPNKKPEELEEEEEDNALIDVEKEDEVKTPSAKSDDEFEGPGGFVRRDTLRPGAPGGTATAPMSVEISTHDDAEVDEDEWTDPMTPASIPPSLPPKSAPNGRDAVGLEAHSQPIPIHLHYSQPMRVPSSGKRHATSTSPPSGGSIRIKHSPVRNRHIPSNEVPFPSAATQQGVEGYPFPDSPTTDDSSGAEAGSSERPTMPSIVPKRERKTTVGRSMRAKHGGRTVSGGVKGVWKDNEGDDF